MDVLYSMPEMASMIWAVGHLWPKARRFAFNTHRHDIMCIVRTAPGKEVEIVYSREGILPKAVYWA
jgi:hypothetical protein